MRCGRGITLISAFALLFVAGAHGAALPESPKAPVVGAKAPDFTLPDANGTSVTLSKPFAPQGSAKGPWVLLVFYRGYW